MTDSTNNALKPCPFCGGEAKRVTLEDDENFGGDVICCTKCHASSNVEFGFKENLVANWNRRADLAPDPLADPRVVALRNLLEEFARQNTTEELKRASLHNGDYEYSHDTFIRKSRAALAAFDKGGKDE